MNQELIRLFIGYDKREPVAYHVCVQSILEKCSAPLSITPLCLNTLSEVFKRPRDEQQLTDFSYTRFLVPYLCQFQGRAIFIDGDMLLRDDIKKLWDIKSDVYSIMVVKHPNFTGTHTFLDTTITSFPKFNWSSIMLFNNNLCRSLTPEYLEKVEYHELHQFRWLQENQVGELPSIWNHLVGYYDYNAGAALVHWTLGGPYLGEKYKTVDYAEEWFSAYNRTVFAKKS